MSKIKNPKYIKLFNYDWYLIKIKDFSPSGYVICQYIDGLFFEQITEDSVEHLDGHVVRHLE